MKTYVVGDIHGCYKSLKALLVKLNNKGWDKLIFLGDYIDRGPNSKAVIDEVMELQQSNRFVIALKGNHEDMCLHANRHYKMGNDFQLGGSWYYNGAKITLESFNTTVDSPNVPDKYLDWMLNLPTMYEDDNAYYVHAGFYPGIRAEDQISYDKLWIRGEFINSDYKWDKPVIHGHTIIDEPFISERRICLDTGCFTGNKLTSYCVETKELVQVDCVDKTSFN